MPRSAVEILSVVSSELHYCCMVFRPTDDDGAATMEEVVAASALSGRLVPDAREVALGSEPITARA